VESSQPTGRLASEPTTRPVSGGEASVPTRVAHSGGSPDSGAGRLILGRYRLEERLGAGGFGVVWRAHDEHLEREVAVKAIPRSGSAATADRPAREARAAARLNHPGIVALYEMGADSDSVYLVSELVPGSTFAELDRGEALSDRDVGRIGSALADALAHAHDRGVIHRDVKPQNVIVLAEPAAGAGFAKLTDFGVAHLVGDDPLTRTGDVVGTLAYMAPEQAEGRPPTGACDVYALALTLYEGLAGDNPMRGRSPAETARLVGRRPPALRAYRRDLPSGLCGGLDACLDPRPERRPDLLELRETLAEATPLLDSRGGLVEPGTLARFGLMRRDGQREEPARRPPASEHHRTFGPAVLREPEPRLPARRPPPVGPREPGPIPAPLPASRDPRIGAAAARVAAGLATGGLVLAALGVPAADPPVPVVPAAGAGALAVALLPRVAWLAVAVALLAWLAAGAGLDGAALLAVVALLPTPLLLPRAGTAWSLPALAPLLGAVALGPAFVGVAGLARTPARRAGLGAAGFLWLAAAEALSEDRLLFGAPAEVPAPGAWESALLAAATEALPPFLSTPALAPALVWALFAALVPLAVRGRSLGLDLVRGSLWAAGLVATQLALGDLVDPGGLDARGAVVGPLAALLFALLATAVRSGFHEPSGRLGNPAPADPVDRPPVA
jgi:hypothetical protein